MFSGMAALTETSKGTVGQRVHSQNQTQAPSQECCSVGKPESLPNSARHPVSPARPVVPAPTPSNGEESPPPLTPPSPLQMRH